MKDMEVELPDHAWHVRHFVRNFHILKKSLGQHTVCPFYRWAK
jgi:hypothetical protein